MASEVVEQQVARPASSATPTSVLVVDDDVSIRKMIVAALRRDGITTFYEASNGREALDSMSRDHPDVVVLDLMMPILSGWDVLQARQKDPALSRIPVVIVSASRDAQIAEAVDKGICAFLPKPFDIATLSAIVKSCIVPG